MNVTGSIVLTCLMLMAVNAKNVKPRASTEKLSADYNYPFEAMVIIDGKYACTATLITKIQLVTVANCVAHVIHTPEKPANVKIRVGSINAGLGSTRSVRRISHHFAFASLFPLFYINDIAVIHLLRPIITSDDVAPVLLPEPNSEIPTVALVLLSTFAGKNITDDTEPSLLIRILTTTETPDECQKSFMYYIISSNQICIDVDPEFRYGPFDMGGPMIDAAEATILGIASGGSNIHGYIGIPKIFTKISAHITYILQEINYGTVNYTVTAPPPAINFYSATDSRKDFIINAH